MEMLRATWPPVFQQVRNNLLKDEESRSNKNLVLQKILKKNMGRKYEQRRAIGEKGNKKKFIFYIIKKQLKYLVHVRTCKILYSQDW